MILKYPLKWTIFLSILFNLSHGEVCCRFLPSSGSSEEELSVL